MSDKKNDAIGTPQLAWVFTTPELARAWLVHNLINRRVREAWVKYLATQIILGRWERTGDAIAFRKDGVLINGQHRLLAIIEANTPAWLLVVGELDEKAYMVTDRGIGKSAADVLKLPGFLLADASMIYRVIVSSAGRIAEIDQHDIAAWWSPAYQVLSAGNPHPRGFSSAAVRIGFGARWAIQPTPALRAAVLEQYGAILRANTKIMSPASAALWKRMSDRKWTTSSSTDRVKASVACYYYADPRRSDVTPLIRDMSLYNAELEVVLKSLEEAYCNAPDGAPHPYLFKQRPLVHRADRYRKPRAADAEPQNQELPL